MYRCGRVCVHQDAESISIQAAPLMNQNAATGKQVIVSFQTDNKRAKSYYRSLCRTYFVVPNLLVHRYMHHMFAEIPRLSAFCVCVSLCTAIAALSTSTCSDYPCYAFRSHPCPCPCPRPCPCFSSPSCRPCRPFRRRCRRRRRATRSKAC